MPEFGGHLRILAAGSPRVVPRRHTGVSMAEPGRGGHDAVPRGHPGCVACPQVVWRAAPSPAARTAGSKYVERHAPYWTG